MHKIEYCNWKHSNFNVNLGPAVCDLLYYTQPDDGSLFSICMTAQSCVTPSCLVVFICLPPSATGWQLCSSYKKKQSHLTPSRQYSSQSFLFAWHPKQRGRLRDSEMSWEGRNKQTYCAGSGKREFKVEVTICLKNSFLGFLSHASLA